MPTTGTVSTTVFETRKIVDHAFRRCKLTPQQITSEHITTALDLLYLLTSTLVNRGIKLWNVDRILVALYEQQFSYPMPVGTVDILNANLRVNQRITGTASSTEGVADNAFDGDLTTACTQVTPAGSITMFLPGTIAVPIYGFLPAVSGSWDYVIEFSDDDITYTPIVTQTAQAVVAGEWIWFDVEGIAAHQYYRLRATGTTVLNVIELVYQNLPQAIPMYQLNRNDYSNLPNRVRTGRPTQFWYDKQRTQPILTVWPNVDFQFTFAQLELYVQRYIQDIGTFTSGNEIEIPQRWYLAIVCELASQVAREAKEVDPGVIPIVDADAMRFMKDAWDGETDDSSAFFRPNISPYTR